MREILFRGKRTDNREWVYGGISIEDDDVYITTKVRYYPDTRDSQTLDYYEENPHYRFGKVHVIPETVGQFTGLIDMHDKKIFEGDIIQDIYGRVKSVGFFEGRWYPFIAFPEYNCLSQWDCAVIGNKWDNPELLEE